MCRIKLWQATAEVTGALHDPFEGLPCATGYRIGITKSCPPRNSRRDTRIRRANRLSVPKVPRLQLLYRDAIQHCELARVRGASFKSCCRGHIFQFQFLHPAVLAIGISVGQQCPLIGVETLRQLPEELSFPACGYTLKVAAPIICGKSRFSAVSAEGSSKSTSRWTSDLSASLRPPACQRRQAGHPH